MDRLAGDMASSVAGVSGRASLPGFGRGKLGCEQQVVILDELTTEEKRVCQFFGAISDVIDRR
jgi:hypothetical protein